MMRTRVVSALLGAALLATATPASAQQFVAYECTDGTQFEAAFLTKSVSVQLDGKGLILPQRLAASGARYSKSGVSLWIKGKKATLKRGGKTSDCTGD
jgi:membrane-bound inhibitor of C-type lysozyme